MARDMRLASLAPAFELAKPPALKTSPAPGRTRPSAPARSADLAEPPGPAPVPAAGPRLRLASGGLGRGVLDGGWWPRSRDAGTELTALLTALPGRAEAPAASVTIDFDDWDDIPLRVTVRGREVRVGWLARLDHVAAVTFGRADPVLLLVVPPGTARSPAEAALARSASGTVDMLPQEILASCDISTDRF